MVNRNLSWSGILASPMYRDPDAEMHRVIANNPEMFDLGIQGPLMFDDEGALCFGPDEVSWTFLETPEEAVEVLSFHASKHCGKCGEIGTEPSGKNPVFTLNDERGSPLFSGCRRCFDEESKDNPLGRAYFYNTVALSGVVVPW